MGRRLSAKSVVGHEQKWQPAGIRSASLPEADPTLRSSNVGLGPIADTAKPLDHFVVAVWPHYSRCSSEKAFVILKKSEAASMQAVCCGRCHAR